MGEQSGGAEPSLTSRVIRHGVWRGRRVAAGVADRLRRGDRTVIRTPEAGLRFGNWLYLWLRAHARTAAGSPTRVLAAPGMDPWLAEFPALRDLTIQRSGLRFHDQREWDHDFRYQRFGVDFGGADVDAFVRDALAPRVDPDGSGALVINVRRGDYYEHEGFRDLFGFDQIGYLRAALEQAGTADRIAVVSDDAAWCEERLDHLVRATGASVEYVRPDPIPNFHRVASARRVIGTNSTFTYWAAHVATVLHPDAQVTFPRFHARLATGSDAFQLDPRWTIIDGFS